MAAVPLFVLVENAWLEETPSTFEVGVVMKSAQLYELAFAGTLPNAMDCFTTPAVLMPFPPQADEPVPWQSLPKLETVVPFASFNVRLKEVPEFRNVSWLFTIVTDGNAPLFFFPIVIVFLAFMVVQSGISSAVALPL